MIRITGSAVSVGKRLPYDVLDQTGRLLLLRGENIATDELAEQLRQHGYRRSKPSKYDSAYSGMKQLSARFAEMEKELEEKRDLDLWPRRIAGLARDLMEISDSDPDAAFANIHLEVVHHYMVVHQLMAALVSCRLALANGLDDERRFAVTAAALTHDMGMLSMRREIDRAEQLTAAQRERVKHHTVEGVRLLEELGIDNPLWLATVRDHHEYIDGSGYAGKRGDDLALESRILALADSYSAMLRPRPYRERVLASAALETLYANESNRYDSFLLELLIWDFGFHPPGSLIRLASHEMAVVIRNTPGILDNPVVAALTDSGGRPLVKPHMRDTRQSQYAIKKTLDPSMAIRSARQIEQCWMPGSGFILSAE